MAKLDRVNQKLFAENATLTQIGKFGSLAAGSPAYAATIDEIQELGQFQGGWYNAILGNNSPSIQDMNGLFKLAFYQIAYLMQMGIAEWNTDTEYHQSSIVLGSDGSIYISLINDNTGNNPTSSITSWAVLVSSGVGTVSAFAGPTAPTGHLICDGAEISRTDYARLFAVIGETYGAGDGVTTFLVPDLRGEFLRGLDAGRGIDTGRALGTFQDDATARPNSNFTGSTNSTGNHQHFIFRATTGTADLGAGDTNAPATDNTIQGDQNYNMRDSGGNANAGGTNTVGNHSHTVTVTGGGDSETRPRNVAMNYIIKY